MNDDPITVIKNDHEGREVWRYTGEVLARTPTKIVLEAFFIHPTKDEVVTEYVVFRRGDRMVETFYTDRWYNVFEIHDVDDDGLKGWYCNFTRPARFSGSEIAADDLALDMFVSPEGVIHLLDEDEFNALPIGEDERQAVLSAVRELKELAGSRPGPFAT